MFVGRLAIAADGHLKEENQWFGLLSDEIGQHVEDLVGTGGRHPDIIFSMTASLSFLAN